MMEDRETILKVENISKQYRLGTVGTGTAADDLKRWWYLLRGKEDPFLKVGEVNDRSKKGTSNYVWALREIGFDVKKGEVLGIIGKNGAGKSTLLKILSRVTSPTTGSIKTKGRIASLLEVGTGFHPELTGRENIYLNGAILGMTRPEITKKIDEIISFSGCERYIDTPTKRYSSGMTVRLGFAVAAHLEPDILVVDEVLAVGDAEFQKKAIGKMNEVSQQDGRTVLFVSHNMAAIKNLCTRCVVLENGGVVFNGNTNKAVDHYLSINSDQASAVFINKNPKEQADILEARVLKDEEVTSNFGFEDQITVAIKIRTSTELRGAVLGLRVQDYKERNVFSTETVVIAQDGEQTYTVDLPKELLVPNSYKLHLGYHVPNQQLIGYREGALHFVIEETGTDFHRYAGKDYGCISVDCDWSFC